MANSKDFNLDKEQLARLQEDQVEGIAGGDDTEFTTPIDIKIKPFAADVGADADAVADTVQSCCKKSC
ncbi:MAG: class I lanthipeptide [Bacteroidota bacterium]